MLHKLEDPKGDNYKLTLFVGNAYQVYLPIVTCPPEMMMIICSPSIPLAIPH